MEVLQIKREGRWETIKESAWSIDFDDVIKAEVPYRCGGYYDSDLTKVVRTVKLEAGKPQVVTYITTKESRARHTAGQLSYWRNKTISDVCDRLYKNIRTRIKKYMPGDVPDYKMYEVRRHVEFEFKEDSEFLTDKTYEALRRFESEMIELSNAANSKDYNRYNSLENRLARARDSERVDASLAHHRSEVARHSGRTTAQQKEWERDPY